MAGHKSISENNLMQKVTKVPKQAGCTVIRASLTLYALFLASSVPGWAKVSIIAALAYFISPIDAIPDFLPGGYVDDLGVMMLLLGELDLFVDKNIHAQVEELLPNYCHQEKITQ